MTRAPWPRERGVWSARSDVTTSTSADDAASRSSTIRSSAASRPVPSVVDPDEYPAVVSRREIALGNVEHELDRLVDRRRVALEPLEEPEHRGRAVAPRAVGQGLPMTLLPSTINVMRAELPDRQKSVR